MDRWLYISWGCMVMTRIMVYAHDNLLSLCPVLLLLIPVPWTGLPHLRPSCQSSEIGVEMTVRDASRSQGTEGLRQRRMTLKAIHALNLSSVGDRLLPSVVGVKG